MSPIPEAEAVAVANRMTQCLAAMHRERTQRTQHHVGLRRVPLPVQFQRDSAQSTRQSVGRAQIDLNSPFLDRGTCLYTQSPFTLTVHQNGGKEIITKRRRCPNTTPSSKPDQNRRCSIIRISAMATVQTERTNVLRTMVQMPLKYRQHHHMQLESTWQSPS